ncbi:winged helix-turn-helix domain-containing protein [Salarchaeum japonicum]|uniref:winged helix-turn-helix domain-containing protein n=1 Tax=Salarchaeum japonicum TaxID=555573 RepID=UPI003C71F3CF
MSPQLTTPTTKHPPDNSNSEDLTSEELFDLFGDEYTRRVYEAIADEPRCGRAVADAADVSRPTAYRRLNALHDAGLVRTEMVISDDGHHRERFEAVADSLSVSLADGCLQAIVSVDE